MGSALAALLSGAVLYVACVAAVSLHAGGASPWWWLAAAFVALCHAASGFLAVGVNPAAAAAASATRGVISLGITAIVSAAALLLVFRFPIDVPPDAGALLLAACAAVGATVVVVAVSRWVLGAADRPQSNRH